MREILFRGKNIANGKWEEGYFCPKDIPSPFGEPIDCPSIIRNEDLLWCTVIPETVGQYTGLTDKNGKKIFEGDIIKIPDDYDEFGINAGESYEIYFAFGGFRLKPKHSRARGFWLEDDETVEIIGNIHDNPEKEKGQG